MVRFYALKKNRLFTIDVYYLKVAPRPRFQGILTDC